MGFCINPILSSYTCESTSMITVYESDGKQLFVVRWSLPWDRPEIRRRCCAEVIVTQITTEAGHSTLRPNCASYRYLVTLLDLIFKMLFGGNIDIYMFWKWWLSDGGVKILKILNFNDSEQTKHHNDKTVTKLEVCWGGENISIQTFRKIFVNLLQCRLYFVFSISPGDHTSGTWQLKLQPSNLTTSG